MKTHSPNKVKGFLFLLFSLLCPSLFFAQTCTEGQVLFESNFADGGPAQISYSLINADSEELILQGGVGFVNDPSESVEICLPSACYALTVIGNPDQLASDFFYAGVILGGENLEMDVNVSEGMILYEFCLLENSGCPNEIVVTPSPNPCGSFFFTIPGFEEFGVQWSTPDGNVHFGSGVFEYAPVGLGVQEVCALLETPDCPMGVNLCATFEPNCDQNCEVFISYDLSGNGGITLYAEQIFGGVFPETYYEWLVDGEFTNNIGFVFETAFDDCEDHEICVLAWNEFCQSEACVTIQTDGCEMDCPDEIEVTPSPNPCGSFVFTIPGLENQVGIQWFTPDGVVHNGTGIFEYTPVFSGPQEVCAFFETPDCPMGVNLCSTFEPNCDQNCEVFISYDLTGNGGITLYAEQIFGGVFPETYYEWLVDGEFTNNIGFVFETAFDDCEDHEICVLAWNEFCQSEACVTIQTDGCESDCPETIGYGNDDCHYWFEVGNAWEDESVSWYVADMVFQGGHYLELENLELSGVQTVSAVINNGPCEGQQLSISVDFNSDCGCSADFEWGITENNVFYASPNDAFDQDIYYSWVIDGEWFTGSMYELETPLECGSHEICLYMESGFCYTNSCEVILVECPNCELDLVYEMDDCSGNFVILNEGVSEISWYLEDGSVQYGNNLYLEWAEDGVHTLCASAILPGCGLVDGCITIESSGCEDDCTNLSLAMDSYVNQGGPSAAYMNITNELGETWFLSSEFGPNDLYFDGELCLPDGCYDVLIDTPNGTENPDAFFSAVFNNGEELQFTYGPTWNGVVYEYGFALNSDCSQDECNLNVEVAQQEGSWYLFNAITDVWEQNVSWFINDEFIASGQIFAYDFPEGNHELCAMIETPDCPEGVWSCMDIVVSDEEFCTPIAIQIVADDLLLDDLWIEYSIESILGEIGGEVYLSSECGETYIMACIPNACYELTLSVEEGLLVPLLMNAFIDGPLSFQYTLDPETAEMNVVFGVNTDCENAVDETTGDSKLKVFPVPTSENLNVHLPAASLGGEWKMINSTGQLIQQGKVRETGVISFNVADFAAGVYHFEVSFDRNNQAQRAQATWIITR